MPNEEFTFHKHARIAGDQEIRFLAHIKQRYEDGASIRDLQSETGRAYGSIHRLLKNSGVVLRSKGGYHRKRKEAEEQKDD